MIDDILSSLLKYGQSHRVGNVWASSATCPLFAGDPGLAQGCWGVRASSPDVLQDSSCFAMAQHRKHLAVTCDAHVPQASCALRDLHVSCFPGAGRASTASAWC